MARENLNDLMAFIVVAREKSFTKAAAHLGVSQSALSHTIRTLESRLGMKLLTRTTRSISLTDIGQSMFDDLGPYIDGIQGRLQSLKDLNSKAAGTVRISTSDYAIGSVIWPKLEPLLKEYPDITLELIDDYALTDIVSAGFDAGIRFGGTVPEDFVAVKLGPELRWVAVASPRYLYRKQPPVIPEDLKSHNCIQIRTGQGVIYRWDFEKGDEHRSIEVPGQVCVNETTLGVELALKDVGITYCLEERVAEYIKSGELHIVLPDWSPIEPAMHLYYPGHRQVPQGLKELIEVLRSAYLDIT